MEIDVRTASYASTQAERMRANWLSTAMIALSHGLPFFHAGDEPSLRDAVRLRRDRLALRGMGRRRHGMESHARACTQWP